MSEIKSIPADCLFIGDLSRNCTEFDLTKLFSTIGPVKEVVVKRSKSTATTLGYGFLKMESHEVALKVKDLLNGYVLLGRPLRIGWGRYRSSEEDSIAQDDKIINSIHVRFKALVADFHITEEILLSVFSKYGPIVDVSVKSSNIAKNTGMQSGYGFVHLPSSEEGASMAVQCVLELNKDCGHPNLQLSCELSKNLLRQYPHLVEHNKPAKAPEKTSNAARQAGDNNSKSATDASSSSVSSSSSSTPGVKSFLCLDDVRGNLTLIEKAQERRGRGRTLSSNSTSNQSQFSQKYSFTGRLRQGQGQGNSHCDHHMRIPEDDGIFGEPQVTSPNQHLSCTSLSCTSCSSLSSSSSSSGSSGGFCSQHEHEDNTAGGVQVQWQHTGSGQGYGMDCGLLFQDQYYQQAAHFAQFQSQQQMQAQNHYPIMNPRNYVSGSCSPVQFPLASHCNSPANMTETYVSMPMQGGGQYYAPCHSLQPPSPIYSSQIGQYSYGDISRFRSQSPQQHVYPMPLQCYSTNPVDIPAYYSSGQHFNPYQVPSRYY